MRRRQPVGVLMTRLRQPRPDVVCLMGSLRLLPVYRCQRRQLAAATRCARIDTLGHEERVEYFLGGSSGEPAGDAVAVYVRRGQLRGRHPQQVTHRCCRRSATSFSTARAVSSGSVASPLCIPRPTASSAVRRYDLLPTQLFNSPSLPDAPNTANNTLCRVLGASRHVPSTSTGGVPSASCELKYASRAADSTARRSRPGSTRRTASSLTFCISHSLTMANASLRYRVAGSELASSVT